MEVFTKYFARLVAVHAAHIFHGQPRAGANGNFHLLVSEMQKISHDVHQANKIAESIETGTEDIFRDFDMSTFMEAFKLDALEKTMLALAFKMGSRSDLKTKGGLLRAIWQIVCFVDANVLSQLMLSCPRISLHSSISLPDAI